MNADAEHQGRSTLLAAFGLAALPPEIHRLTVDALRPGASMAKLHEAAHAIANDAPVTCLQGVIGTLLFLAQERSGAALAEPDGVVEAPPKPEANQGA